VTIGAELSFEYSALLTYSSENGLVPCNLLPTSRLRCFCHNDRLFTDTNGCGRCKVSICRLYVYAAIVGVCLLVKRRASVAYAHQRRCQSTRLVSTEASRLSGADPTQWKLADRTPVIARIIQAQSRHLVAVSSRLWCCAHDGDFFDPSHLMVRGTQIGRGRLHRMQRKSWAISHRMFRTST